MYLERQKKNMASSCCWMESKRFQKLSLNHEDEIVWHKVPLEKLQGPRIQKAKMNLEIYLGIPWPEMSCHPQTGNDPTSNSCYTHQNQKLFIYSQITVFFISTLYGKIFTLYTRNGFLRQLERIFLPQNILSLWLWNIKSVPVKVWKHMSISNEDWLSQWWLMLFIL